MNAANILILSLQQAGKGRASVKTAQFEVTVELDPTMQIAAKSILTGEPHVSPETDPAAEVSVKEIHEEATESEALIEDPLAYEKMKLDKLSK